jgi:hypothetical protein
MIGYPLPAKQRSAPSTPKPPPPSPLGLRAHTASTHPQLLVQPATATATPSQHPSNRRISCQRDPRRCCTRHSSCMRRALDHFVTRGASAKNHVERRDAQDEFRHSAAQARAWAGGDFDADHGFGFDGVGRSAHYRAGRAASGGWRVEAAAVRSTLLCISPFHDQDELQPKVGRRFAGGTACRSYRILLQDFGRLLHAALVSTLFFPLECRFIFHRAASGWLVGACPSFPFPSTSKWARLCICHTAMRLKNANTYV